MDALLQDVRYALRALRRSPVFTAAAVVTLALGIGANTAVFSVVHGVLLRALPYPDPDRLVLLWGRRGPERVLLATIPDVVEWERRNRTFDAMTMQRSQSVNLTGVDAPDRLIGSFVTASTFSILGARAELGHVFTPEEAGEDAGQLVAVLSHAAWMGRFGGAKDIVGRTITLNGRPHAVVGVLAPEFRDPLGQTDVYLPLSSAPGPGWNTRTGFRVWAIGRLKPGVTIEQAQQDLSTVTRQLATEFPASNDGWDVSLVPLKEWIVGPMRAILLTVFGFVGVVLLIACANVANLQMARATARRRELSLRAALGAGRARLARQLLTENLLLSLVGGGIGVLVAVWATRLLVAAVPGGLPGPVEVSLDTRVILFSALATLGAGLLFGAAPALYGGRVGLREALDMRTANGGHGRRFGARDLVVAGQLALCVVLLVGAGLLTRTLLALRSVDPGFDAAGVVTAEFRLPVNKYDSDQKINAFMASAIAAIRAVPGVKDAALVQAVPLSGNWGRVTYELEGQPVPTTRPAALANAVTDGFFRTMRMPIKTGRDFDARDRQDAPHVAIVSEAFARQAWPAQSPLGRRVRVYGPPDDTVTVVGVVNDLKQRTLTEATGGQIWQPFAQSPGIFNSVVARTDGDADALGPKVRAAIWSVDPDQPVWKVRTQQFLVDRDIAPRRFALTLTGIFAVLAVILATIGVYGVMSYLLAQRTREIGIRMALGARRTQVQRLVLGRSAIIAGAAMAVGLVGALAASKLLASQLYGVDAADPLTLAVVPMLLLAIAMLASWIPARRASRVDPMIALRTE